MAKGYEFRRTNQTAIGNIGDSLKVWNAAGGIAGDDTGGKSIYYSPDDFTAIFAAGTQLTIGAIANLPAALTTERFSQVIVTRVNGDKTIYNADDPTIQMIYAAPTLTVTGAAFLATDLGYKVTLYFQEKSTGIDGVAPNNYVNIVGGIDRTAANVSRRCDINAAGELLVRSDAAANFLCTEANSANILTQTTACATSLALIDNIVGADGVAVPVGVAMIAGTDGANARTAEVDATRRLRTRHVEIEGTHDSAFGTTAAKIQGNAHSGNPAPVTADNDAANLLATLIGQLRVYMDSALNRTNDEVKNEDIPPPEIVAGGKKACGAVVGTPVQLTAISVTLRRGVWLQIDPKTADPGAAAWITAGVHYTSAANSIFTAAGATVAGSFFRRTANAEGNLCERIFIDIDDPSKLYLDADAPCDVVWQGI